MPAPGPPSTKSTVTSCGEKAGVGLEGEYPKGALTAGLCFRSPILRIQWQGQGKLGRPGPARAHCAPLLSTNYLLGLWGTKTETRLPPSEPAAARNAAWRGLHGGEDTGANEDGQIPAPSRKCGMLMQGSRCRGGRSEVRGQGCSSHLYAYTAPQSSAENVFHIPQGSGGRLIPVAQYVFIGTCMTAWPENLRRSLLNSTFLIVRVS